MELDLDKDSEKLIAAIARSFAAEGRVLEVTLLASAKGEFNQTSYDNWDNGQYYFALDLLISPQIYEQIRSRREELEKSIEERGQDVFRRYESQHLSSVRIHESLVDNPDWRSGAIAWSSGKGISNQGRVRSANIASKERDGLLFRSEQEILLYSELKSLGIPVAPLAVFVRGGSDYKRIEPDFVIVRQGIVMVVEIDGDTVHRESPAEAHARLAMLTDEGIHVERVRAADCETPAKAKATAARIVTLLEKKRVSK